MHAAARHVLDADGAHAHESAAHALLATLLPSMAVYERGRVPTKTYLAIARLEALARDAPSLAVLLERLPDAELGVRNVYVAENVRSRMRALVTTMPIQRADWLDMLDGDRAGFVETRVDALVRLLLDAYGAAAVVEPAARADVCEAALRHGYTPLAAALVRELDAPLPYVRRRAIQKLVYERGALDVFDARPELFTADDVVLLTGRRNAENKRALVERLLQRDDNDDDTSARAFASVFFLEAIASDPSMVEIVLGNARVRAFVRRPDVAASLLRAAATTNNVALFALLSRALAK